MSSPAYVDKPVILVAAGGTGGHVFPALAVANALREADCDVIWVGTPTGIEASVVAENGFPMTFIRVVGLRGKPWSYRLLAPFLLLGAVFKIACLLRTHHVRCVLCMGGYVSAAAGIAAYIMRRPLLLQEQNAVPGSTNKLLAPLADKIFTGFPKVFEQKSNAVFTGNPLREQILAIAAPELRFNPNQVTVQILVIGGSLGASIFNQLLPNVFAKLNAEQNFSGDFEIIHQTGKNDQAAVAQSYQNAGVKAQVLPFINDMAKAYSNADLVIARAGALTVAELAAIGVASILVPYPYAIDDHQMANAQWLVNADAAICIAQSQLDVDHLAGVLVELLKNRNELLGYAKRARAVASRDATITIANACREYACA